MSAGDVSSRSAARSRPRWMTTSAARFRVVPLMIVEDEPPVPPPRGMVRRVALADLDLLDRHAERLRQELGEHRLVALALALGAELRDQPIGRDLDDDMLVGDAAGAVQMAGEAEAAPLARSLRSPPAAPRSPARRRPSAPSRTGAAQSAAS